MIIKYKVQVYNPFIKRYDTVHIGHDLERAKIQACKPYNTHQGQSTTRVVKIIEEVIHKFTRNKRK